MRVFISWSGESSRQIAEALRWWLPSVIQAIKPYFSPDDITKGSRWSSEIAVELQECKVGLIVLTPKNLDAAWVMFEAGALSKSVATGRVCPMLFGVEPSDVKGPLVQFQATPFAKDEVKKTVKMMNQELGGAGLTGDVLDSVFEMWWPKLDERIASAMAIEDEEAKPAARSDRDMLEEVLARVRAFPAGEGGVRINPEAASDLIETFNELTARVHSLPPEFRGAFAGALEQMRRPVGHIARRAQPQSHLAPPLIMVTDESSASHGEGGQARSGGSIAGKRKRGGRGRVKR